MARASKPDGRNLIVCCDGTSNEIVGNSTNVLKLYRIAVKDDAQRVFYDAGIGAIASRPAWGRLWQHFKEFLGLATGFGLDENILRAYRWLCEQYQPGDRIYLFGFSRGAYTVRALAGLIHMIGLLSRDQLHLTGFALTAYKRAAEQDDLPIAWQFARLTNAVDATIHFLGVWDTVASVLVPRPDRLYLPSLQFLPYTKKNDRIVTVRHAVAIDERRAMFRNYNWDGDLFRSSKFAKATTPQDQRQVWFAGVHADVGGGYAEEESALAKFPLRWMLGEAQAKGLRISKTLNGHLVEGKAVSGGNLSYVAPDSAGMAHQSLKGPWWLLEIIPKRIKWRRWPKRRNIAGFYFPWGEPRFIPEGAFIHESAVVRKNGPTDYQPINWPSAFAIEPDLVPAAPTRRRMPKSKAAT